MLSLVGVGTGVTSASVGGTATVNDVIERELLRLPAESVTLTVQFEYVPSASSLKVIVLLLAEAEVVELVQLPP